MRGESPEITEQSTDVRIPSLRLDPNKNGFITGFSGDGAEEDSPGNGKRPKCMTGSRIEDKKL